MRSLKYKVDELSAVIETNHINIACITESWLNADIETNAIDIGKFVCYRRDRSDGRKAGGVACYVDPDWPCSRLHDLESPDFECLWLLLRQSRMPRSVSHIAVGVIYHPPDAASSPMLNHLIECIDRIRQLHPSAGIAILGDFNSLHDKPLRDYPMQQVVAGATRGKRTLDKIFTNISQWYAEPTIMPAIATSDHCTIVWAATTTKAIGGSRRVNVTLRSNNSNGRNLLAHALAEYDWQIMHAMDDIDGKVAYFNDVIMKLLNTYLPLYTVVRCANDKPWVTTEFKRLIRRRQFAWSVGDSSSYRTLRNKVNRLTKQLRENYYKKIMRSLHSQDARSWWRGINKLTGRTARSSLQPLINSEADGDMQRFVDLVNNTLCAVSHDLKPIPPPFLPDSLFAEKSFVADSTVPNKGFTNYSFSEMEVFTALTHINVHKSPGPDDLPNWVLRDYSFALAEPLCHIFNYSLQHSVMPSLWKEANVVVIPKCQPPSSVQDDLRPISLTPTLSKVLERLVGRRLLPRIASKFDYRQYGALKGRSTTHALLDITHMCHQALDNHQSVRCTFIDFSKAFDHVDHVTVLQKMAEWNVDSIFLNWMHSYLYNRRQRVKVGSTVSSWLRPNGGMPQGSFFGPFVFLILINDLLADVPLIKFVDDITAVEIVDPDASSQMQSSIDQVVEWCKYNHMIINSKKTKDMLIGPMANNPPDALMTSTKIERVTSFKLLGVILSNDLCWHDHVETICLKAGKRLHYLSLLKRSSVPEAELVLYYKSVVRPVLEYACPIWQTNLSKEQRDMIEKVQKRALTIINGSGDYLLQCASYDMEPMSVRLNRLTESFYERICKPQDCLNWLLPPVRPTDVTNRLRHSNNYPLPRCRTERFKSSFLPFCLFNFQT